MCSEPNSGPNHTSRESHFAARLRGDTHGAVGPAARRAARKVARSIPEFEEVVELEAKVPAGDDDLSEKEAVG